MWTKPNQKAFIVKSNYVGLLIFLVHACSIKINIKARNQRHTHFLSSHIKPKKNQHPTTYQIYFFTFQMNSWIKKGYGITIYNINMLSSHCINKQYKGAESNQQNENKVIRKNKKSLENQPNDKICHWVMVKMNWNRLKWNSMHCFSLRCHNISIWISEGER